MSENIKDIMGVTMDKIRSLANTDTVIGDPIVLNENVTCIPVSKVTYGFASGGSDFGAKAQKQSFGGGGGAGMSITPVAFLAIQNDNVRILPISSDTTSTDKAISLIPELFDKVTDLFKKDDEKESDDIKE